MAPCKRSLLRRAERTVSGSRHEGSQAKEGIDQVADVLALWVRDQVDILGGSHVAVRRHRYPADENEPHAVSFECLEQRAEVQHSHGARRATPLICVI